MKLILQCSGEEKLYRKQAAISTRCFELLDVTPL